MSAERSVLVIDDDPLICEIITACLEDWPGTEVCSVLTGQLAAEKIRAGGFDLAVIDALLPEVPGLKLMELAANENIPIVAMSGDLQFTERLKSLGCPVLGKPFPLSVLLEECKSAVADAATNIRRVKDSLALLQIRADALDTALTESRHLIAASKLLSKEP